MNINIISRYITKYVPLDTLYYIMFLSKKLYLSTQFIREKHRHWNSLGLDLILYTNNEKALKYYIEYRIYLHGDSCIYFTDIYNYLKQININMDMLKILYNHTKSTISIDDYIKNNRNDVHLFCIERMLKIGLRPTRDTKQYCMLHNKLNMLNLFNKYS